MTGMWGQEMAPQRLSRMALDMQMCQHPLGLWDCCCTIALGLYLLVNLSDPGLLGVSSQSLFPPGPDRTGLDAALSELPGSLKMY